MEYNVEPFNSIKRQPIVWKIPLPLFGKILLLGFGGGMSIDVVLSTVGMDSLGHIFSFGGIVVSIVILFYFRNNKNRLKGSDLSNFFRNLNRVKEIR